MRHGTHLALLLRSHISKSQWRPLVQVMFVTTNPLGDPGPRTQAAGLHPMALQRAAQGTPSSRHQANIIFHLSSKTHCQHAWFLLRICRQCVALEARSPTMADTTSSTNPLASKRTHPSGRQPRQRALLISRRRRVGIPNTCVIKIIRPPHGRPWPLKQPHHSSCFRQKQPYLLPWGSLFFIARSEK